MTQLVDVFIASPSDVEQERRFAEATVQQVSARTRDSLDIALNPVRWENFLPSATKRKNERVQDRFNARVTKCGIFIGILGERYGTGQISGTEEEFIEAMKHRHQIEILTYFRRQSPHVENAASAVRQAAKLLDLQDRLKEIGLCKRYETPEEFQIKLTIDLFDTVIRISTEKERRDQLRAFFRLGVSRKRQSPSVLLGYPTIHGHATQAAKGNSRALMKSNWQERLLPNVVYEDFKAIQKIEGVIHFTGVHDISSVTLDSPKLRAAVGNRIWLCVPRNELAQRELARLKDRTCFSFERPREEARPHIIWQPGADTPRCVRSPLALYLARQKRPKHSCWKREFSEIVARDFAVISRFALSDTHDLTHSDPFFHYFIAGIRGLGTWGAAWYIDNKPDELERLSTAAEEGGTDPQVLLEVTFSNHRIFAVRDVSGEPPEYFQAQLSPDVIDLTIDAFR